MKELERPYEIYEWEPGEVRTFTILRWEKGELEILPKDRPPKMITVVRVHVPEEEKPTFPHYWDLTASRITAQLIPLLEHTMGFPVKIRVKADRFPAPKTHYEVGRLPA